MQIILASSSPRRLELLKSLENILERMIQSRLFELKGFFLHQKKLWNLIPPLIAYTRLVDTWKGLDNAFEFRKS